MSQQCVIFCAMPTNADMLRYVEPGAFLIAADAGYHQMRGLGLCPHMIVGDFDSSLPPGEVGLGGPEIITLPAEKDDTDSYHAVRLALQRGFKEIVLLGAMGGRLDHTLANLQTLLHITRSGARGVMPYTGGEWRCMGAGKMEIAQKNTLVSIFSVGGPAAGVYLHGMKYPLVNATLTPDYPIGISNKTIDDNAMIECESGNLFVNIAEFE